MNKAKKKILVTGCAGLIGSNFCRYMLDKGYSVVGIDNLSGGYLDFVPIEVTFYAVDLKNHEAVDGIVAFHKPDTIYHMQAMAAEGLSPFVRRHNYTENVICAANIINSAVNNNIKQIVALSSMAVYGNQNPPFTEKTEPKPVDSYGVSKYAIELDLKCVNKEFGLEYVIVRPHNFAGIQQNIWDLYRNVIGIWIRKTLNNESITIFGDGSQVRAFSDVDYCLEPLEKIMYGFDGETFNIGADKEYKLIEVAKLVQKIANKYDRSPDIVHLEPRMEVHKAYCTHDKAKKILGFKDETDIEKLIDKMFVWAMGQPRREVKYLDYEIEKKLYPYWKKNK